jgi:magnesium chelatase family protein
MNIIAAPSLMTLINHLRGEQVLFDPEGKVAETQLSFLDMSDLVGLHMAKRAMEIPAVGGVKPG